jgi:hypothetical protein
LRLWPQRFALIHGGRLRPKKETQKRRSSPKKKELSMYKQFRLTNLVPRAVQCGMALAGLMQIAVATPALAQGGEVLSPLVPHYGYSYEEWSAKYWQWSLGQSTNDPQAAGPAGFCLGEASGVWFLNGASIPGSGGITIRTNKVVLPPETPLFFPILSVYEDNTSCPLDTFGSLTGAQLAAEAVGQWSVATLTSCTIDGVAVTGIDDPTNSIYDVVSPPFSYSTAEKDNVLAGFFGEPCIPGGLTVYPAVSDGVFLMLSPFKPGKHVIHYVGIASQGNTIFVEENITFEITVL